MLQTQINHGNQEAELASLINQLEETQGKIQLQQTNLAALMAIKEQLTTSGSGPRTTPPPTPSHPSRSSNHLGPCP